VPFALDTNSIFGLGGWEKSMYGGGVHLLSREFTING
jgi:hypothetical protein